MNQPEIKLHRKSVISVLLIIAVLCVLFMSNQYISEHIRHNCTGEGCPVCAEIQFVKSLINQAEDVLYLAVAVSYIVYVVKRILSFIYSFIQKETLISKKVRLND
ncbi:MAG: hypothetical protein QM793_11485 [Muricomes sp.]